jgi:macrodomain Ter protein organizer (MatP/YcbG family)
MNIPEDQRHTKKLQIRADPDDYERFREIAAENHETLGETLNRLLETFDEKAK